jgi:glyoxylase-like metal-dependent hydrolase (beta-lactamase superfamily II)
MQIRAVKPGVFACLTDNQTANAGFVVTQRGVIAIDTLNSPAQGRKLAAAIRAHTDRPILFVINTHHHYDHVLGNQAFEAPVIAHCALAEQLAQAAGRDLSPVAIAARISEHPEDRWLADELELVYPNLIFEERLLIDLPPLRLVVQHLGGHTPESTIVDLPAEGVLFAGDLVFEGRVPFLRQAHIDRTVQALRQVERLGTRTIVPGHGALCDMSYVSRLRDYVEQLREKVGELIDLGWEKADILDAKELPRWWTSDRPDLLRANVIRVHDELAGASRSA